MSVITAGMSFIITVFSILALSPLAYKINLVDIPGGRKQHAQPTPVIGGIAMLLGFLAGLLFFPQSLLPYRGLIFGSALLVFVGVLDDFHELSPRGRLVAQLIAISLMIFWSDIQLNHLGRLTGEENVTLGLWSLPLTFFGAASLINAVNMLDGLDGLSGSIVAISLISLSAVAFFSGYPNQALVMVIFLSAISAYLLFNFPFPGRKHAVCFMGDAGSMLLGFVLSWFTISLSQVPHTLAGPAVMLWINAIPLLDLATVFTKRLLEKRSPFHAGRDHLHHFLQARGFSSRTSCFIILFSMVIAQGIAWLMIRLKCPDSLILIGFIGLFAFYSFTLISLGRKKN